MEQARSPLSDLAESEYIRPISKGEQLLADEVERYTQVLNADLNEAFRRYGYTLLHSLAPSDQVRLRQKLGMATDDAIDLFNLAGLEIEAENYAGAVKLLEKAAGKTPTLADAYFNLALCFEKLGKDDSAKKAWNTFLEIAESEEDKAAVREYLGAQQ